MLRACVVYDTRFGNTEKIAMSLGKGLAEAGVRVDPIESGKVAPGPLEQYDLICVGAPTEGFTASKPIKEFLAALTAPGVSGRLGFAFDTRVDSRLSGSAARFIEKALQDLGLTMIAPRESAIVRVLKTGGAITGATLRAGEEQRFEQIGIRLGGSLAARMKRIA